jgi:hypothetical protein
MNEPELKAAAFALAEVTPKHLDRPTIPPISWRLEGDQLRVLLADGRTVRGPIPSVGARHVSPSSPKASSVMALPVHTVGANAPAPQSGVRPPNPPAHGSQKGEHNAGK